MEIHKGELGLGATWQQEFPKTTKCVYCGGEARVGFTAMERSETPGNYISDLYDNKNHSMWLHDACAVSVYFCKECLQPTALYNQA